MPYEVCYRALLSISVVEATHDGRAPPPCAMAEMAAGCAPAAGARATLDHRITPRTDVHPQDSLAGGPPARWFVISDVRAEVEAKTKGQQTPFSEHSLKKRPACLC